MSIGTLIGILGGLGLFLGSIMLNTSQYSMFWSASSFLMVIGGTIAATFIAYKENYALAALKGLLEIFKQTDVDKKSLFGDVGKVVEWAKIVKKGGLRELETNFDEKDLENPVVKYSMEMVFSNDKPENVYRETENLIETIHTRKNIAVEVLDTMASFAPAFGMIGTLVGLVILLNNLSDKDALGSGMSVALITTLYGVLFANLILKPAARKLEQKYSIFKYRDMLLLEGIHMLPKKPHHYLVQNHLNSFLDPSMHFDISDN